MDPSRSLYTRREIAALTGLDDATLNYWSREGLLVPSEGGDGRGRHRRFDFVQVNIAAMLLQLRTFRLALPGMRSFAGLLQEAASMGADRSLHPANYLRAAQLASRLRDLRQGREVLVRRHRGQRPDGLDGPAIVEWASARVPARAEREVVEDTIGLQDDYDPVGSIEAAAERIGPDRETVAQLYADLVFDVLVPGYTDAYSWLVAPADDGTWRIAFGDEGAHFFAGPGSGSAEDFGPAMFVPASGVIRRLWGLRRPLEYRLDRQAERIRDDLAACGIAAEVDPVGDEEGFVVTTAADPSAVEAALGGPSMRWRGISVAEPRR